MASRSATWLAIVAVSLGLLAACSPAAPPSPTTAPQKEAAERPAQPKAEAKPAARAEQPAPKVEQPAAKPAQPAAKGNLFQQLVQASEAEMVKKAGKLSIALEWDEQDVLPVLEALKKDFPFIKEATFRRERQVDAQMRILAEAKAGRPPKYDIMHVADELWPQFEEAGLFAKPPFSYKALIKQLPDGWTPPDERAIDPKDEFMATAGLARGNAWNKNLVPAGQEPRTWDACTDPKWKGKVLYDPRSKLDALWWDTKTRDMHMNWLRALVANNVVLSRGQTENLEKMAAGEFPIFCGVNFHSSMRIIDQGAPIEFDFPDPFPLEFGTQIHVVKWSETPATSQLFTLWLGTKAQPLVEKSGYRGMPWDPGTRKYPLAKGKYVAVCDSACLRGTEEYQKQHADILKLPGA